MKRPALLILAALVVALVGSIAILIGCRSHSEETRSTPQAPITIRYATEIETNIMGLKAPIFWVTNHTDSELVISLNRIEIKSGTNWNGFSSTVGPSLMSVRDSKQSAGQHLAPHEAGYAGLLNMPFANITIPSNAAWRAKTTVAEVLEGVERIKRGVESTPRILQTRSTLGTNYPVNPFATNIAYFGQHVVVYSDEVVQP